MFYSPSTNSFYLPNVHKQIPEDAVHESEWNYTHMELVSGQSSELMIAPDSDGLPTLMPREKSFEQIVAEERKWRDIELSRADIELNKVQDGVGVGTVSAWRAYRCGLRDWPTHDKFPNTAYRPVAPK